MIIALLGNFAVDYCSEVHHAASLESLGHRVIRLQETTTTTDTVLQVARAADVFVWVHTHSFANRGSITMDHVLAELRRAGVPSVAYHLDLYMGLQRWRDYEGSPYMQVDHFFTVDKLMADWFNANSTTRGHYLPAAVFADECYIAEEPSRDGNDIIFVGSRGYHPEWPYRPQLIDWLYSTYGVNFSHIGGDGQVPTTRGAALNRLYAASKIAIGDTLCIGFDYPYYLSDRVFETLGRGGMIIHPRIRGIENLFTDREHLVLYDFGDFDGLAELIDHYLVHDDEREQIRRAGHEYVKDCHTYAHRWAEILEKIA